MLGVHSKKPHKWTVRDRILAMAIRVYDGSIGEHGLPSHIAQDANRRFVVEELWDEAANVLAKEQEKMQQSKPEPGTRLIVVDKGEYDD